MLHHGKNKQAQKLSRIVSTIEMINFIKSFLRELKLSHSYRITRIFKLLHSLINGATTSLLI